MQWHPRCVVVNFSPGAADMTYVRDDDGKISDEISYYDDLYLTSR